MEFSRPEYWSGQPFPSPGDLPNPGIEPRCPALRADSLPAETQEVSLKLANKIRFSDRIQLNGILIYLFMTAISNHGLCVYKVINVRELVIKEG